MIRNETEYRGTVRRIKETEEHLANEETRLTKAGRKKEEIKRLLDAERTLALGLREEVEVYERLRRGDFSDLARMEGIGQVLVALRIGQGLTQRDLAEKLGVDESQISRDERNEYQGISVDRAMRIVHAMGFKPELSLTPEASGRVATGARTTVGLPAVSL
jgi:DNA-binding XRE family transcriptional regulator